MISDIAIRVENLGKQYRIGRRELTGLPRICEAVREP